LPGENSPVPEKENRGVMEKALKIIEERLDQPEFNAMALCKALGESEKQLNRFIHKFSGLNITRFIRLKRLERAARLLRHPRPRGRGGFPPRAGKITQVAYDCGFNNLSYFARCFRQQYGKSPSEFLNEAGSGQ
jgi:AraC-like DNA-binding protein